MYRNRATLFTIKSVTSLTKVRFSCSNLKSRYFFVDSFKILNIVRYINTATDRTDFQSDFQVASDNTSSFQNSANGAQVDISSDHRKAPYEYYGERSRGYQRSSDVFYRENQNSIEPARNSNWDAVNRETLGGFQQKPIGSYGERPPASQQSPDGFQRGNQREFQHNVDGFYGKNPSDYRNNQDGFYGGNPGDFQQGQNGAVGENIRTFQQNTNGFNRDNVGHNPNWRREFWQNPVEQNTNSSDFHRQYPKELQHNANQFYPNNSSSFQQIQNEHFRVNASVQDPHVSFKEQPGEAQRNPNRFYQGSPAVPEGSLNGSYKENNGEYPHNPNGYYRGNIGQNQQYPNVGTGGNVGVTSQNQNGVQGGTFDSRPVSNVNSNGEPVESAECSQYKGTIEELDELCKEGKVKEAVEVLGLLEKQCVVVDLPRYLQLMQKCGEAEALQEAKSVHSSLMRSTPHVTVSIYNKVLEMYSKCGSMSDAYDLFEKMPERNLTSWDTMIAWLAKNGLGEDAILLFTRFKEAGLKPDSQMFVGVFAACGVLGDIDEGMLHFESMRKDYGITPSMEHYVSMVDMLATTGYLNEAMEFIERMPFEPSVDVWETLMNLCRVHGNTELGDHCTELVECLDPTRLTEQSKAGLVPVKASDLAKEKEKKKIASQNLLEVRSRVHEYRAGDTSHPDTDKIYAQLRGMRGQMKEAGYVPETRFVLHDVDQESKEEALLAHSERLAVAYGLLSSPARSPIRVIKNLRVCGDCHTALKIISKLVGRELIIRDAKRFHHFKDGLCSCRDYW